MKFSQFIESGELSLSSPITREEWDRITDVELERTEEITFRTPSGKEVPFRKVKRGEWQGTVCSICGASASDYYDCDFCPNCGADMRGREETDE